MRIRWWLYNQIDRLDTYCFHHIWVPTWIRIKVGQAWEWTFRDKTWTAVGEDAPHNNEKGYAEIPCEWDEYGNVIDRLRLSNTHDENLICLQRCVIHNRTDHHMSKWPLFWRGDRKIFERICSHGIGHPDPDQGPYWRAMDQEWQWVHGCCGVCCTPPEGRVKDEQDES